MYTHLHNHTEYSLLDGLSQIKPMVQRSKDLGMTSLAITDHGGLYGAIEFYAECKELGIKPIIGLETYLAQESRYRKSPADKSPYHLLLLARNNQGYSNLIALSSKAHLEGFYYKPRVDKEILQEHSDGLIALSGCPSAELPRLLLEDRYQEAVDIANWYKQTFEYFFLEIQRHTNLPELEKLNKALITLSRETGIPLVATNDCHYTDREDAPYQDILICIHTNTNIHDDKRLQMSDDSYYIKSPAEMEDLFSDLPEAISATQTIADMCNIELDFGELRLPEYQPENGMPSSEYLAHLCNQGLQMRYGNPSDEVKDRLEYELDVINKTQFDNYMLVVWDIAKFSRDNKILFGVRGSAAASLVLYCLGVTDIDPLKYRLVFERFLNLERHEMPDIDMDFQDDRREEVISYVRQKYGGDHVAQIITFGTMGAKAAIRDTGRALNMDYGHVDKIAKLIPLKASSIEESIETIPELNQIYSSDNASRNLLDTAKHLEGVVRNAGTHAAGVVITKEPLVEYLPLQRPIRGESDGDMAMTQFPMEPIAKLGLLKMDFLGLTNLTILSQAKKLVEDRRSIVVDIGNIPLEDQMTFDLLASGETTGVFQLEGSGMRRYIQRLMPTSLADISAMIALYRPGPMEHIDTYIDAKHGKTPPKYPHPTLRNILEETHGVIVYQDQVLLIAQAFAGYSLGEADIVRKAMGKKIPEVMRQEKQKFLSGALAQGFSGDLAEEVFQLIEPFAGYAFNKAHSISYAMIAYLTAYFKANYTEEYLTALMNAHTGQGEKIGVDVTECLRLKIPVLLPDINRSGIDFTIDLNEEGRPSVRFGLASIKNIGASALKPLISERDKNGIYTSIEALCRRTDLSNINRRGVESLIKAGAMDCLTDRGSLLASMEQIMAFAQREAKLKESGQTTMFDLLGEQVDVPFSPIDMQTSEISRQEKMFWEKELLGTFVSENPLTTLAYRLPHNVIISKNDLDSAKDGQREIVVGQVSTHRSGLTKAGKPFSVVTLDMLGGNIEIMVWSDSQEKTKDLWYEGSLVQIVGKVRYRDNEISVTCYEATQYILDDMIDQAEDRVESHAQNHNGHSTTENGNKTVDTTSIRKLWIRMEETDNPGHDEYILREVVKLLMNYPGQDKVGFKIVTDGRTVIGDLPLVNVEYSDDLASEISGILGEGKTELIAATNNTI